MASIIAFGELDSNGVLQGQSITTDSTSPIIDLEDKKTIQVFGTVDSNTVFQFAFGGEDGNMFLLPQTYSVASTPSVFSIDVPHTEAKYFQVFVNQILIETMARVVVCFK